jgi:hypothetical protein
MSKDQKSSMTEEQQKKAIAWLERYWKQENRKCEICLAADWLVLGDIITPMIFSIHGFSVGNAYPQFMVVCKNCGHTKYFNAMIAKITEKDERQSDGK